MFDTEIGIKLQLILQSYISNLVPGHTEREKKIPIIFPRNFLIYYLALNDVAQKIEQVVQ